jgi:hypothetical protein
MTSQLVNNTNIFGEKINNIKSQFFSALDDFKKYYVYYNKNPEVNEFQNFYINSKTQLQTMSRDLFLTTNNIDKQIEFLDGEMKVVSIKLEDEKLLNVELMKLFTNLQNTQNGTEILINNSKEEYNEQYYNNLEIICGIFITGALLATMFKKSNIVNV